MPAQGVAGALGRRAVADVSAASARSRAPSSRARVGSRSAAVRPSVPAVSCSSGGSSSTRSATLTPDPEHGPALVGAALGQDAGDLAPVDEDVVGPLDHAPRAGDLGDREARGAAAAGSAGRAGRARAAAPAPGGADHVRPWRPRPAVCSPAVTSVPCGAPAARERPGAVVRRVVARRCSRGRPSAVTPGGCGPRRRASSPRRCAADRG